MSSTQQDNKSNNNLKLQAIEVKDFGSIEHTIRKLSPEIEQSLSEAPYISHRIDGRPGDFKGIHHLQHVFPDIAGHANHPPPRSPPRSSGFHEITTSQLGTEVGRANATQSKGSSNSGQAQMVTKKGSDDGQAHVHEARNAAHAVKDVEETLFHGLRVIGVFSTVVGDNFAGTEVIATMVTTEDGMMHMTYRDHVDGFECQPGTFRWSEKALAFKRSIGGEQDNGDDELDHGMATAFMNNMEFGH